MQSAREMMSDTKGEAPLSTIWQMVLSAAVNNILDDPDMPEESARQENAHQEFSDFMMKYKDALDTDVSKKLKDLIAASARTGVMPVVNVQLLRDEMICKDHALHKSICIIIELASQVCDEDNPDHEPLSRAIDIVSISWAMTGDEFCALLTDGKDVKTPDL